MALIKCKECGKEISDTASKCIHCGYPLKKSQIPNQNTNKTKVSNVLIWLVAFLPLISAILYWGVWYITNSWMIGMVILIAVVLVSSIFLILKDYKTLNECGIDTESFGKMSIFKIVIPKYIYNRVKILGDNLSYFIVWIVCAVFYAIVIVFGFNPLYLINNSINLVKDGTLYACPDYTVEQLVNNYMDNPKWETGTTVDGDKAVNIKGTVTYNGKPVKALIQYFIKDDEFEFNAFEMDGVPQSTYLYSELITDMCKSASKDETTSKKDNNDSKVNPEQYYKEITIDDFFSIFDGNFKSVVYLGIPDCKYCQYLETTLKEIIPQYKFNVYYMDAQANDIEVFKSLTHTYVKSYPTVFIVQNGMIIDTMIGYKNQDNVINFLTRNGIIGDKASSNSSNKGSSETIKIDNYVGENYLDVKSILESKGLNVIIEEAEENSSEYEYGEIVKQSITPNSTVKAGDTIQLYVVK